MTQEVRLWEITGGDTLKEINQSKLNLEERIENWLEDDISIISKELLVIGRQVNTEFGGTIDILCLDVNGDVIIVELKRDKTPREITAQVLDYASWVKDLSYERIDDISAEYFGDKSDLKEVYMNKFGIEFPDVINENHKMLIVASEIDSSSERIIKYLSDTYGVGINVLTFNYFKADNKEYLSRVYLIDPDEAESNIRKSPTKKPLPLTLEESQKAADNNGVGEVYKIAFEGLSKRFNHVAQHTSGVTLYGYDENNKSRKAFFALYSTISNPEKGLVVYVWLDRLARLLGQNKDNVQGYFPTFEKIENKDWADGEYCKFYFKNKDEVEKVLSVLLSEEQ